MEAELIAWLRSRLPSSDRLLLGLGDDAAILQLAGRNQCVITTDLLSDGVDFRLSEVDPRRAGHKSLAANLSDLAAMAARPLAVVVSLALPRSGAYDLAVALYEGMLPLASRYNVAIAGGDTNVFDGPLTVSITAIGEVTDRGPLTRRGAKPDDRILVTGQFGGSILSKHLDFEPRVNEALLLTERYSLQAGMDCSDGLSLDLSRLAKESGCGAEINLVHVPIAAAARELAKTEPEHGSPLDHALGDGEDFELILAASPPDAARILAVQPLAPLMITDIGRFTVEPGLWSIDSLAQRRPLQPRGFLHRS